jgi:DNA-3-methyladenine glycosylase II
MEETTLDNQGSEKEMTPIIQSSDEIKKVQRQLARRDPILKRIMAQVGHCTLSLNPDGFGVLARSIVSQQISTRAAMAISGRLIESLGRRGLRPAAILAAPDNLIRAAGMSASKVRSLRDLAEKCHGGDVPLKKLAGLPDEEVIALLTQVRGIGRWTAEMFLIFSLGRLDVLPIADYGLRAGVQRQYGLPELPKKDQLFEISEPWRPYRTIATWFFWRSLGGVPQS